MKAKIFTIKEERHKESAVEFLADLPLRPVCQVVIRDAREIRSTAQNSLLHKWHAEESEHTGELPDEVKRRYKKQFLVDIFMQREDGEYARLILTLRKLHKEGHKKDAVFLYNQVVDLTHTADASVEEMTAYLNYIEIDARQRGVPLSRPDDLYRDALGVK